MEDSGCRFGRRNVLPPCLAGLNKGAAGSVGRRQRQGQAQGIDGGGREAYLYLHRNPSTLVAQLRAPLGARTRLVDHCGARLDVNEFSVVWVLFWLRWTQTVARPDC